MRYFLASALIFVVFSSASSPVMAAQLARKDAIAKVQRETGGKVLSAETKQIGRQVIYRIKVLTREGKVKIIEVPADDRHDVEAR